MQSVAELWTVLQSDPTVSASADPLAILAAMGRAVDRGLAAGHWPGRGPRDEAWEQIVTPPRWQSPGMSVTCNIAWTLVRGDANTWLSVLRRWRSSRRGA